MEKCIDKSCKAKIFTTGEVFVFHENPIGTYLLIYLFTYLHKNINIKIAVSQIFTYYKFKDVYKEKDLLIFLITL